MDIFDEDILNFWKALQECDVKYIIIGGYAINLQGYQRFTGDIDIWLNNTLDNRQKLRKAFITCDMGDYSMIELWNSYLAGQVFTSTITSAGYIK